MAEPSKKSEKMEESFRRIFGFDRRDPIRQDVCGFCGEPATEFKDELSRKEYTISGLCQACQDLAFSED